ncbi:TetR/AcrR family transcriptional regulator [Actinomycetospora endophytica]|uniref:TetR/AcrR family transcriptional regulator n=1 Tax=Actinomycetospora endophytica TaxID=2291215 RepID=A0ABS8P2W6_9PSEU|nr:TetR/AcrR family transcriptional regulator [Actinomycetospora endophytica]MCD2192595.1 TetR/AcrR family transcriptional regulator [Actinomycetospora endophytica]
MTAGRAGDADPVLDTATDDSSEQAPARRPAGPRRSREQRTSDSRQRILDAAVSCLVESGYARTTTLTIQARAGVSRGRLLHHFPSKETLLVAAAQHLAATRFASDGLAAADLPAADDDPDRRIDRVVDEMWSTFRQPYFWASVELWTAARTDPALATALLPAERRLGAAIRQTLDAVFERHLDDENYPTVREMLLTSMRGVAMTYGFDPRDHATDPHLAQWKQMAKALLRT